MVFFLVCLMTCDCASMASSGLLAEIGNLRNLPTGTNRFCSSWLPLTWTLQAFLRVWVRGLLRSVSRAWSWPRAQFQTVLSRSACPEAAAPAPLSAALAVAWPWLLTTLHQFLLFQRSDFERPTVSPVMCSFQSLVVLKGRESTKYSKCWGSHCCLLT